MNLVEEFKTEEPTQNLNKKKNNLTWHQYFSTFKLYEILIIETDFSIEFTYVCITEIS